MAWNIRRENLPERSRHYHGGPWQRSDVPGNGSHSRTSTVAGDAQSGVARSRDKIDICRRGAIARRFFRIGAALASGLLVFIDMHVPSLIEKKRDGGKLTAEEIEALIEGFTDGEIPDYKMRRWG